MRDKLLRSALELAIEESICEVYANRPNLRDEAYGCRSAVYMNRVPAILLVGLYIEYGCDVEDLASELLCLDFRKRDKGNHPGKYNALISGLYQQYQEFCTSPCGEGEMLRARKAQVEQKFNDKLAEIV